jgi:hypothetical protein
MEKAYFAHPIDIHLSTQSIQGWPKIHVEVWHHDDYNRQEIYGYGTVFIPTSPGQHTVKLTLIISFPINIKFRLSVIVGDQREVSVMRLCRNLLAVAFNCVPCRFWTTQLSE